MTRAYTEVVLKNGERLRTLCFKIEYGICGLDSDIDHAVLNNISAVIINSVKVYLNKGFRL